MLFSFSFTRSRLLHHFLMLLTSFWLQAHRVRMHHTFWWAILSTRITTRPYSPTFWRGVRMNVTSALRHKWKPNALTSVLKTWIFIPVLLYTLRLCGNWSNSQASTPSSPPCSSYSIDDTTSLSQRHLMFCNTSPALAGFSHLAHVLGFAYNICVLYQRLPLMSARF